MGVSYWVFGWIVIQCIMILISYYFIYGLVFLEIQHVLKSTIEVIILWERWYFHLKHLKTTMYWMLIYNFFEKRGVRVLFCFLQSKWLKHISNKENLFMKNDASFVPLFGFQESVLNFQNLSKAKKIFQKSRKLTFITNLGKYSELCRVPKFRKLYYSSWNHFCCFHIHFVNNRVHACLFC